MLTAEEVNEIEERAEAWVNGLDLRDEAAFHAAIESQLERLTLPPLAKRRATVLALAPVGLTEASRRKVFRQPGVVTRRIFYDTRKDW